MSTLNLGQYVANGSVGSSGKITGDGMLSAGMGAIDPYTALISAGLKNEGVTNTISEVGAGVGSLISNVADWLTGKDSNRGKATLQDAKSIGNLSNANVQSAGAAGALANALGASNVRRTPQSDSTFLIVGAVGLVVVALIAFMVLKNK